MIKPEDYLPGGSHYTTSIANGYSSVVTRVDDPVLRTLMPKIVRNGNYSLRVEDTATGGFVSVASQKIKSYFCLDIYFAWLAVLENGGHNGSESNLMIIELKDMTKGDTLIMRRYNAGASSSGVDTRFTTHSTYFYTPSWQVEHLSIDRNRTGHDFQLNVLATDCGQTGHLGYVYIDSFGGIAP
ncbi:unnamed protein product [Rotaria sp. Silwood2]|nr:unnamed protein product [Rotaria sp. Silwood2]CAF4224643.1 unnamed protein product [Rotaria sp. Silwood2]